MDIDIKMEKLKDILKSMGSAAVAYSGGVDSTFLLKVAHDVLGDRAIAVTCESAADTEKELEEAKKYAELIKVKLIVIKSDILSIPQFAENPKDRCYYCKKTVFSGIKKIALESNIQYVLDGTNADDSGDYRPGMKAVKELDVKSPLKEADFTKDDIRAVSKEMNLPTWNKPSCACLASRIPYYSEITLEKLKMVEEAEQYLMDLGFRQVRVRHHGNIARIEVAPEERSKFFDTEMMDKVSVKFRNIGFTYAALELSGYKTGSMNKVLSVASE